MGFDLDVEIHSNRETEAEGLTPWVNVESTGQEGGYFQNRFWPQFYAFF